MGCMHRGNFTGGETRTSQRLPASRARSPRLCVSPPEDESWAPSVGRFKSEAADRSRWRDGLGIARTRRTRVASMGRRQESADRALNRADGSVVIVASMGTADPRRRTAVDSISLTDTNVRLPLGRRFSSMDRQSRRLDKVQHAGVSGACTRREATSHERRETRHARGPPRSG